ncbi:hypothetical protein D3C84_551040 [compost metagenome]
MADAASSAHPLQFAGMYQHLAALVVAMLDGAAARQHDDFEVVVRVHREAGARLHAVVVERQQRAEAHAMRIDIVVEAEAEARVEPVGAHRAALCAAADLEEIHTDAPWSRWTASGMARAGRCSRSSAASTSAAAGHTVHGSRSPKAKVPIVTPGSIIT